MKNRLSDSLQNGLYWLRDFVWRRQFLYAVFLIILLFILIIQLSIIPPGSSQEEIDYIKSSSSINAIGENPLYLPHKVATYGVRQFSESVRFVRAISIIFYSFCVVALYRILKRWHSEKIALFGSALFASNATVLIIGRLATPEVLLFGWAIVIAVLLWLHHGSSRKIAPLTLAVVATGLLYVPGAPYFLILLLSLFSNQIVKTFKHMKRNGIIISIVAFLIVLGPLIASFIVNPNLIKNWLLLPEEIILNDILKNILSVPSAFIYKTPENSIISLGTLPIFDVASGGLFLIGLYAYQKYIKLERTKIMILTALLGVILGALGQVILAILIILPFAYSVIGAGISYLLDLWYSVFPKNPIARSFGLLVITFVVLMSVYYQLTRFLVVWANAPETRKEYSHSRIIE